MAFNQVVVSTNKKTGAQRRFRLGANIPNLTPRSNKRFWDDVEECIKNNYYGKLSKETPTFSYELIK